METSRGLQHHLPRRSASPICHEHSLSAYDASYLAIALGGGWPIAALDKALSKPAQVTGVAVLQTPMQPNATEADLNIVKFSSYWTFRVSHQEASF